MTKPKTGQGGGQMNEPKPTLGRIVSFQPKPDVRKLLEDAKAAGLDITEILNAALLEKGPIVARKMAEDQKGRIEAFLKEKGGPTR